MPLGTALFCFPKKRETVIEQTEQIIADKFDKKNDGALVLLNGIKTG